MWQKNKVVYVSDIQPTHNDYCIIYSLYNMSSPRVEKNVNAKVTSGKTIQTQGLKSHIRLNSTDVIKNHCQKEWTDDYQMQKYCIDEQREALRKLNVGCPSDIPNSVFGKIRNNCIREWYDDYEMRAFCEEEQFKAWRQLK